MKSSGRYIQRNTLMKKLSLSLIAVALIVATAALPLHAIDLEAGSIAGDYLEARTAEVFVGYCLANSETGLVGQEAVMAWRIREGEWSGVPLEGLTVVAVVEGTTTLGDVKTDPVRGRSVIVVDANADARQKDALISLVRSMAGQLVDEIVSVHSAPIVVELDETHGLRAVRAGDLASVEVRPLRHEDGLCGNEDQFYPPLVDLVHAHPAYTLQHEFRGTGLNSTWKSPGKSSAFVGTFAR